jgi:hypothetical protein
LAVTLTFAHRRRARLWRGRATAGSKSRHLRHRQHRHAAALKARSLAGAIIDGRDSPTAHLAAGVVLQLGEIAWIQAPARLVVRSSFTGWEDHGRINWLITSQRIVGRYRAGGQLISVWWSGLAGVHIDLDHDRLTLNAVNGWTGQLSGPDVSLIAVAAVGMCHGPESLAVHPALLALRGTEGWQTMPPPEQPRALIESAPIVTISSRRRTS